MKGGLKVTAGDRDPSPAKLTEEIVLSNDHSGIWKLKAGWALVMPLVLLLIGKKGVVMLDLEINYFTASFLQPTRELNEKYVRAQVINTQLNRLTSTLL